MKEKRESDIHFFMPCVKIYYDDIKRIVEVLSNLKPKSIHLDANNTIFEFSEIGSLNTDSLTLLEIRARFGICESFSIKFSKHNIWIYCSQNTTQTQGVARQIENLLKTRRRVFGLFTVYYLPTIALYLSAVVMIVVCVGDFFEFFHIPDRAMTVLGIIFLVSGYLDSFYGNKIFLQPKNSYKNIIARTKDQLFVNIVSNIVSNSVSVVLGAIIGFLLGRFTK